MAFNHARNPLTATLSNVGLIRARITSRESCLLLMQAEILLSWTVCGNFLMSDYSIDPLYEQRIMAAPSTSLSRDFGSVVSTREWLHRSAGSPRLPWVAVG